MVKPLWILWGKIVLKDLSGHYNLDIIKAAKDALGDKYFTNVVMFSKNMMGLFIPPKYYEAFVKYCTFPDDEIYSYNLALKNKRLSY